MAKYRKKPEEIEARRFITNNEPDNFNMVKLVDWINAGSDDICVANHDGTSIYMSTPEGTMCAKVGDYIIKSIHGWFYPCKPDIFAETYEFVMDDNDCDHHESFICSSCGERFAGVPSNHVGVCRNCANELDDVEGKEK